MNLSTIEGRRRVVAILDELRGAGLIDYSLEPPRIDGPEPNLEIWADRDALNLSAQGLGVSAEAARIAASSALVWAAEEELFIQDRVGEDGLRVLLIEAGDRNELAGRGAAYGGALRSNTLVQVGSAAARSTAYRPFYGLRTEREQSTYSRTVRVTPFHTRRRALRIRGL